MATMFGSIANIFRPVTQTTSNQPVQQTAAGEIKPAPAPPANPLDQFTSLWQNDPNAKPPADPLAAPLFNTDPAKIAAAASKMDIVGQLDPELMAKAMSGQDPSAFMTVLNTVAQRTLSTSAQLNASTIEQATARNNSRIQEALPAKVKQIQLDSIQSDNPALQHPASQPLLNLVRSQVQMKNPGMSAAEINSQAERALLGFASQVAAPAATQQSAAQSQGGTDWDSWVNN